MKDEENIVKQVDDEPEAEYISHTSETEASDSKGSVNQERERHDEESVHIKDDSEKSESEEEASSAEDKEKALEELTAKLQAAEEKAEENYQRFLRAQADFENYRRRTRQEIETLQKYAALPIVEALLPVLDNFERAIQAGQNTTDAAALLQGVEMVFKQINSLLEAEGVEAIEAVGQPFDPHVHEAVMQVESDEHRSGEVVEELQKGYKLKDKVIRPAMVKVNK